MARPANRGWRIDYICISKSLEKNLKSADILESVEGSDHCPVIAELEF
jgi:exodeoxyribonuclease-3